MTGKILSLILVVSGLAAGIAMYYLQVYGYYDDVAARPGEDVLLLPIGGETPEPIAYGDFEAIDADSSPIRYRACFTTPLKPAEVAQLYEISEARDPRNAPGWFDCFDATAIGTALEAGEAQAYLGERNIQNGFDRVVALFPNGQGFAWHQLNGTLE